LISMMFCMDAVPIANQNMQQPWELSWKPLTLQVNAAVVQEAFVHGSPTVDRHSGDCGDIDHGGLTNLHVLLLRAALRQPTTRSRSCQVCTPRINRHRAPARSQVTWRRACREPNACVAIAGILSEALQNIKGLRCTPHTVDQGAISK